MPLKILIQERLSTFNYGAPQPCASELFPVEISLYVQKQNLYMCT